jgi:hypothetical protein
MQFNETIEKISNLLHPEPKDWDELSTGRKVNVIIGTAIFVATTVFEIKQIIDGIRESRRLDRELEEAHKEFEQYIDLNLKIHTDPTQAWGDITTDLPSGE